MPGTTGLALMTMLALLLQPTAARGAAERPRSAARASHERAPDEFPGVVALATGEGECAEGTSPLELVLYDTFGDGWNGNSVRLNGGEDFTFTSGSLSTQFACLAVGYYNAYLDLSGSYDYEVYFEIPACSISLDDDDTYSREFFFDGENCTINFYYEEPIVVLNLFLDGPSSHENTFALTTMYGDRIYGGSTATATNPLKLPLPANAAYGLRVSSRFFDSVTASAVSNGNNDLCATPSFTLETNETSCFYIAETDCMSSSDCTFGGNDDDDFDFDDDDGITITTKDLVTGITVVAPAVGIAIASMVGVFAGDFNTGSKKDDDGDDGAGGGGNFEDVAF
mmetsp:Transcript_9190/g.31341  ORF Transcript_9190/g.31341 Transcript_9190/m.31341 type:complete len:339 (+) Transcript_9190:61-1077(+)